MGVIIPVVGLCIIGWFWFSPTLYVDSWNPHHAPFFSAVGSSIAMTLWAFLGLESACANTDVVENPERNVPIAVLGGTLGAAVIYIVSTNVIAGIVPNMGWQIQRHHLVWPSRRCSRRKWVKSLWR